MILLNFHDVADGKISAGHWRITKRWTRSRGGDKIGTNYADGVAIVSAPSYLRVVSSRLGHRKRYLALANVDRADNSARRTCSTIRAVEIAIERFAGETTHKPFSTKPCRESRGGMSANALDSLIVT